jgi:hypothetical protein
MKRHRIKILRDLRGKAYEDIHKYEREGEDIMRCYSKGNYNAFKHAHDIAEDDHEETHGFFQGSLKVATVLGFLYIVGYVLSIGFGG